MASQLDIVVTADTASATSSLGKVAAAAEREMARASRAALAAAKDNDRFVASIEKQVATFGLSGTALLRYEAQVRGVSSQVEPLISKLEAMKSASVIPTTAASNASSYAHGLKEVEGAASTAAHGTAGITRELLVLGHEASQGNWKRLGGSFLVLGELGYAAAGKVLLAWGPLIALGVAAAAVAAAFVKGALESAAFRDGITLTGNAAGLTAGRMDEMARSIATNARVSATGVRSIIQELATSGEVGPRVIAPMAEAIARVARISGESAESVAKDYEKMSDGVLKWALEHNKQYHAFGYAQLEYIKQLEEQGKKEEAEGQVLDTLNNRFANLEPKLTGMAARWFELRDAAGQAWDIMAGRGRVETIEDKLAAVDKRIQEATARQQARAKLPAFSSQSERPDLSLQQAQQDKAGLQEQQRMERRGAEAQAQNAANNRAGAEAVAYETKMFELMKGRTRLEIDLAEQKAAIAKRVQSGGPEHIPEDDQLTAFLKHRDRSFQDKAGEKLQTEFQTRLLALDQEGVKLDRETAQFQLYGKAIDKSRVAMLELELAQGKLKELSPAQKNQLLASAKKDDDKEANLKQVEEAAKAKIAADKFVASLKDVASAHAQTAREADLATKMAELDRIGVEKGSAAYASYAAAIETSVTARHDDLLVRKLAAEQLSVDDEVHKLDTETAALGMSAEARREAAAALKIYNEAQKDLAANPGQSAEIEAARVKKTDDLTAALRRNQAVATSFDTGARTAFQNYADNAANAGKFAEQAIGGGLDKLTDALAKFAETGKLHLRDLFVFMAEEFLKQLLRMQVASAAASATKGFGGVLGSVAGFFGFGGSPDGAGGIGNAEGAYPAGITGGATGANNLPGDGLMYVHKGEAIVPAAFNPVLHGGSQSQGVRVTVNNMHSNANVQAKDDGNGGVELIIAEAARRGSDMAHARINGELLTGGTTARSVQSRFGLSPQLASRT